MGAFVLHSSLHHQSIYLFILYWTISKKIVSWLEKTNTKPMFFPLIMQVIDLHGLSLIQTFKLIWKINPDRFMCPNRLGLDLWIGRNEIWIDSDCYNTWFNRPNWSKWVQFSELVHKFGVSDLCMAIVNLGRKYHISLLCDFFLHIFLNGKEITWETKKDLSLFLRRSIFKPYLNN